MLRDKMRWTAYSDLLEDEYRQCLQEGLQVEPLLEEIRRIQTLSDGLPAGGGGPQSSGPSGGRPSPFRLSI